MTDTEYMQRAIRLAVCGVGHTSPNPLVGAVIVKDGHIIGEGYHERYGSLHAERNALKNCTDDTKGAVMYVTLEPCCHYGKQPPCTEAIIEAGIKKVIVGSADPNPKVAGGGIARLREAGVEVETGFMKEECDALNPVFFHYISTGEPYVALKYAMTADGKTATPTGKSQWITGEDARKDVHGLRRYYTGILAGIGTVLADDPMLNCRLEYGRDPVRIIMDSRLRIPETSRIMQTAGKIRTIIVCAGQDAANTGGENFSARKKRLEELGAEVIEAASDGDGRVSVPDMLKALGKINIDGILVEGGGTVNAAFVKAGKVNRVYAYVGSMLFGGDGRFTPVKGSGIDEVSEALKLANPKVSVIGSDVRIRYDVTK